MDAGGVDSMYQIDSKKFGDFLGKVRKDQQMTQKELAEQLFVSDKTVSKWERGGSLPSVSLLIPISEVLGISVTELLRGERMENAEDGCGYLKTEVEQILDNKKKKRRGLFFFSLVMVLTEYLVLWAAGMSKIMILLAPVEVMFLLFGGWLCMGVKEVLPAYYDQNKINVVMQGPLKLHMTGLSFHNGNWPVLCKVLRTWILGGAVVCPIGAAIWERYLFLPKKEEIGGVLVFLLLAGWIGHLYYVGKKYE